VLPYIKRQIEHVRQALQRGSMSAAHDALDRADDAIEHMSALLDSPTVFDDNEFTPRDLFRNDLPHETRKISPKKGDADGRQ